MPLASSLICVLTTRSTTDIDHVWYICDSFQIVILKLNFQGRMRPYAESLVLVHNVVC